MMKDELLESVAYLKNKGFDKPEIGIVLGTGLGKLVNSVEDPIEAHYNHIPFFPLATVEFHTGKLVYGTISGKKVVVMQGRFHLIRRLRLFRYHLPYSRNAHVGYF